MKKSIFLMAVAALAMTSCTNEETLQSNLGEPISFRAAMGTRTLAEGMYSSANLPTTIYVTAFQEGVTDPIFEDVFTKQTDNSYTSTSDHYWPATPEGSTTPPKLSFFAYTPSTEDLGDDASIKSSTTEDPVFSNIKPKADIKEQVDFIYGAAYNQTSPSSIQLTFQHQLAQIRVFAKENNPIREFKIAGVKIGHVAGKGSFPNTNYDGNTDPSHWGNDGTVTTYEATCETYGTDPYTLKEDVDWPDPSENNLLEKIGCGNAMLLPQLITPWNGTKEDTKGSYLAVLLQVKENGKIILPKDGTDSYVWAAAPITDGDGCLWVENTIHEYLIDFTSGVGVGAPDSENPEDIGKPLLKDEDNTPITFTIKEIEDYRNNTDYNSTMK